MSTPRRPLLWHESLGDPSWIHRLFALDALIAQEVRSAGCPCGGRLHSAAYPRKPRGLPPGTAAETLSTRASFCCDRDGCRKRSTPPSLVFLGRRVFVGVIVLLGAALRNGPSAMTLARIVALTGASLRTVRRWIAWWRESFTRTHTWQLLRGRFALVTDTASDALPAVLLRAAETSDALATIERVMRWLLSLHTGAPLPLRSSFAMLV